MEKTIQSKDIVILISESLLTPFFLEKEFPQLLIKSVIK